MSSHNVVILGATGYIGQGAALHFLKHGYTVVAQSREQSKLDTLKTALVKQGADVSKLHFVTGSFQTDAEAKAVAASVQKLIGVPQHVLSILGFFDAIKKPASETTPEELKHNFEDTFYPNVRAANVFIPLQKGKVGTFTQLSGGLAHGVYVPAAWAGSFKNATMNSWAMVLAAELADNPLRFINVCLHFGVSHFGGDKNQLGMPSVGSDRFGVLFPALASDKSKQRGTLCTNTIEEVEALVKAL